MPFRRSEHGGVERGTKTIFNAAGSDVAKCVARKAAFATCGEVSELQRHLSLPRATGARAPEFALGSSTSAWLNGCGG